MNLNEALVQFDIVEANLKKLETVWLKLMELMPDGIAFIGGGPEGLRYRQLQHDYDALLGVLPPIDGWSMTATPVDLDAIGQMRLDAAEAASVESTVYVEEHIFAPTAAMRFAVAANGWVGCRPRARSVGRLVVGRITLSPR